MSSNRKARLRRPLPGPPLRIKGQRCIPLDRCMHWQCTHQPQQKNGSFQVYLFISSNRKARLAPPPPPPPALCESTAKGVPLTTCIHTKCILQRPISESPYVCRRRSGPNLEPGTIRVYVTNGPRNGLHIGRKVGPCPGSRRRWVLGCVRAFSQALHAANTYRPRF